jgi:hypothetical protein
LNKGVALVEVPGEIASSVKMMLPVRVGRNCPILVLNFLAKGINVDTVNSRLT